MPTTVALGKNCVSCFLWPLGIVEACRVSRILSHALCCLEGRVGSTTVRIPSVEVNNQLRLLQRFDTFTANVCVWFALSSLVHRHCCQRSKANWQVCCIAKYCSSVFFQLIDDTDFHAKFIWDRFLLFPKKSQINQRLFFFSPSFKLGHWVTFAESGGFVYFLSGLKSTKILKSSTIMMFMFCETRLPRMHYGDLSGSEMNARKSRAEK